MNNKRYWLFGYEHHYPLGGFKDFIMSSDSAQECKSHIASLLYIRQSLLYTRQPSDKGIYDGYYDIVDTESMEIIYSIERSCLK